MTLQIGSREHRKEGLTGESWGVPVGDFTGRAAYAQALLQKLSNVLNRAQFITNDIGFSASVFFTRPGMKGGKRAGGGPGQKSWSHLVEESRCVCEIKNKDSLCCARASVMMREYAKRQAGEHKAWRTLLVYTAKNLTLFGSYELIKTQIASIFGKKLKFINSFSLNIFFLAVRPK